LLLFAANICFICYAADLMVLHLELVFTTSVIRQICLHNGAIPLILKIEKSQICFVANLILGTSCEFFEDDVAVMSFINIKYGDVRTEIIP